MPRATTEPRRSPSVVPPAAGDAAPPERVFRAKRILKVGSQRIMPGQVVPGAKDWTRLEAWIRTGAIEEAFGERPHAG